MGFPLTRCRGTRPPSGVPPQIQGEHPPSLPRVPAVQVPLFHRYYGDVRLPASLTPRFVAFAWHYQASRWWFRSHRSETPTEGQGFVIRSPLPDLIAWRRTGPPRFLENPLVRMPCSSTPARPNAPGHKVRWHGPRSVHDEGSCEIRLSRLNSTASGLTVYASPQGLPPKDATLVSGCWPSSTGRDSQPVGFLRKVSEMLLTSHPPFPSFSWRKDAAR